MATAKPEKWTESRVFGQLRHVWPAPAHSCIPQVRNGTGYARNRTRTADALVFSTWPSRGLWLGGVEIKVSRSDWKKELADPGKASDIAQYCHHWYVAAPEGIVPVAEVPETWGLVEVKHNTATIVKRAPLQEVKPIDMLLLCSIMRQVAEVTVPADIVKAQIADEVAKHKDLIRQEARHPLERLQEDVDEFERASGVRIHDTWELGDIAKAVAVIRESGSVTRALEAIRNKTVAVRRFAEQVDEALAEAGERTSPPQEVTV